MIGMALLAAASMHIAACPVGVPTQAITVVNHAHASRNAITQIEHAVTDQSLQLRAAWGTPCVRFTPRGGWPLELLIGAEPHGQHISGPSIDVWTGGLSHTAWEEDFSHEILETLVDPTGGTDYVAPGSDSATQLEIADPVDRLGYRLDGAFVADFVTPAYFAGAQLDDPAHQGAANVSCPVDPATRTAQCVRVGLPLIAPADATGPYDELGRVAHPLDTSWEWPMSTSLSSAGQQASVS